MIISKNRFQAEIAKAKEETAREIYEQQDKANRERWYREKLEELQAQQRQFEQRLNAMQGKEDTSRKIGCTCSTGEAKTNIPNVLPI